MHQQSQWLFEILPATASNDDTNLQYDIPLQEWEVSAGQYDTPLTEDEWEVSSRRVSRTNRPLGRSRTAALNQQYQQQHRFNSATLPARETVGGFPRYSNSVRSLPWQEQQKINQIARLIVNSYESGQYPIRIVRLLGHADKDTPRRPDFEKKISGDRALRVQGVLMEAIEHLSRTTEATSRPWPPISTRINWQRFSAGATQLLLQNPKTELERSRNRRVEIHLYPARHRSALPLKRFTNVSSFAPAALTPKLEAIINEFCRRIASEKINRMNCFKAVEKAAEILSRGIRSVRACRLQYAGWQLVNSKEINPPLSNSVICCPWRTNYLELCTQTLKGGKACGHCSTMNGRYLVLKYKPLQPVITDLKCVLDQGCIVKAGVLSGICDDKPDVTCARKVAEKAGPVWRDCPEHWILILGYDGDRFLFWDSSRASSTFRWGESFGLLHFDRSENRLSTAAVDPTQDTLAVDPSGHHVVDDQQKRYQVLELHIAGAFRKPSAKC